MHRTIGVDCTITVQSMSPIGTLVIVGTTRFVGDFHAAGYHNVCLRVIGNLKVEMLTDRALSIRSHHIHFINIITVGIMRDFIIRLRDQRKHTGLFIDHEFLLIRRRHELRSQADFVDMWKITKSLQANFIYARTKGKNSFILPLLIFMIPATRGSSGSVVR